MRSKWTRLVLIAAAASTVLAIAGFAQTSTTEEGKRKVKTRVSPVYPDLAKRMNVTGRVKIEVVVAADGHVKSTRVVGGHPLLVQSCQDAVKEWKFTPGEEATQIVEFDFNGNGGGN
jgi:TonB family protein